MTPPARSQPAPTPEALGHIQADRPCARCGFNLFGQPIFRDEHYQMPAARCPECGQVVSLQEYPGLGVWARRWSAMLAAVWLLLTVGYLAFTITMVSAPVGAVQDQQFDRLAASIYQMHQDDERADTTGRTTNYRPWSDLPEDWAQAQDLRARVTETAPVRAQLDPEFPVAIAGLWLTLYAVFLPWPVLFIQARRIRVTAYLSVTLAAGAAIVGVLEHYEATSDTSARSLALGIAWPTMLTLTYGTLLTAALAAAYTGRPLARALVRAALPPRLRLPFAELWRADNKSLPAITGR